MPCAPKLRSAMPGTSLYRKVMRGTALPGAAAPARVGAVGRVDGSASTGWAPPPLRPGTPGAGAGAAAASPPSCR